MQTDLIQKQLQSSLTVLKNTITDFEQQSSPSKEYIKKLHSCVNDTNTLVSAYLILKESEIKVQQEDIISLQELQPTPTKTDVIESLEEPVSKDIFSEPVINEVKLNKPPQEIKITDELVPSTQNLSVENIVQQKSEIIELPKISININDKFRFINELFGSNSEEFSVAIEQLNNLISIDDCNTYIKGLQSIYEWKETNEVVKHFCSIARKRFI